MKAAKILAVVLLFFTNYAISQEAQPEILKKLHNQVDSLECVVDITFRIELDGTATVLKVDSEDPKLIEYVLDKFDKIQVSSKNVLKGKVMTYRFKFKISPDDLADNSVSQVPLIANFVPDDRKKGHPHHDS